MPSTPRNPNMTSANPIEASDCLKRSGSIFEIFRIFGPEARILLANGFDFGNPGILVFGPKILEISKMLPHIFRQSEASIGLSDVIFGFLGVIGMFLKRT